MAHGRESILTVLVLSAWSAASAGEPPLTLERAVALALERNIDINSQAAEVEASRARLDAASPLLAKNPELAGAIGPRTDGAGRTTLEYGFELGQEVELAGQRGVRVEAATTGLEAARARLEHRKVVLAAEIREAFGQALAAEAFLELQQDAEVLARQGVEIAEARHQAGAAARIEVNAARVELGRAIRERTLASSRRAMAFGELRLLLGLEASHPLELAGELSIPTEVDHPDVRTVLGSALANRQDLVALQAELLAAQAEQRLANREWVPNPRLGASVEREETDHIIQGTLSFALPIFDRNQGGRGVATARARQAEQALQALRTRIQQEAKLAVIRHDAAHEAAQAYAGGIVQAMEENLALIDEGYRAGKLDFAQLLLFRRETLEARRGYIEALDELNRAEAQLSRTLGRLP